MAGSAVPETCWLMDAFCLRQGSHWDRRSIRRHPRAVPGVFRWLGRGVLSLRSRCSRVGAEIQLASGDVVFTHGARTGAVYFATRDGESRGRAEGRIRRLDRRDGIARMAGECAVRARAALCAQTLETGSRNVAALLVRKDKDLVEPVLLAPRDRPNRHPCALHPWDYANLLALMRACRARRSRRKPNVACGWRHSMRHGNAVAMGTAPVESDGSFFVQVPGDKPIRFALLDEKGAMIRAGAWLVLDSRGEQRYLRGMPYRAGACFGESRTSGLDADHRPCRSDRIE